MNPPRCKVCGIAHYRTCYTPPIIEQGRVVKDGMPVGKRTKGK
jgi:hypothetical protein